VKVAFDVDGGGSGHFSALSDAWIIEAGINVIAELLEWEYWLQE
tara:strand:- start:607 stop:738 length:132 start_codon:yes stop_codon:yes gene_type:complete